jgi:type IV pilus assembly protein PilQ
VAGAQSKSTIPDTTPTFRVYEIRAATALDLKSIVTQLLPGVTVVLGPQPGYLQHNAATPVLGEQATLPVAPPPAPVSERVIQDEMVRTLVLSGGKSEVDRAIQLLELVDKPAPQVLIEAHVVEIQAGDSTQFGVSWNFAPGGATTTFTEGTPSPRGHLDQVLFGHFSRSPMEFAATLEAAISHNHAKLLAHPQLLALYNHRAEIFVGDEVSYLIGSQTSVNGTTLQTDKVRVGVELSVVATAHPDGTIVLRVHPEVGQLEQVNTLANGVSLPQVSRRFVDTQVRIKDGDTLVIGGLMGDNRSRTEVKLPVLGDLPLIGYLFRHEEKSTSHSEVLIFLRATIAKDAG